MITPIHDRLLVRLIRTENVVNSGQFPTLEKIGLVIPEAAMEQEKVCGSMIQFDDVAHTGEVIATGPGKWVECDDCGNGARRPMSINVGDVVRFGRFADFGKDGLLIIQEDDVLGVMSAA